MAMLKSARSLGLSAATHTTLSSLSIMIFPDASRYSIALLKVWYIGRLGRDLQSSVLLGGISAVLIALSIIRSVWRFGQWAPWGELSFNEAMPYCGDGYHINLYDILARSLA